MFGDYSIFARLIDLAKPLTLSSVEDNNSSSVTGDMPVVSTDPESVVTTSPTAATISPPASSAAGNRGECLLCIRAFHVDTVLFFAKRDGG